MTTTSRPQTELYAINPSGFPGDPAAVPAAIPADTTARPLRFSRFQREQMLNRAWWIGASLVVDGRVLRFYPEGSTLTVDGHMPYGIDRAQLPGDKHYEVGEDVLMQLFEVRPGAPGGCGLGYLGAHLSREEANRIICRDWKDEDFIHLAATLGLNASKQGALQKGEIPERAGRG